MARALVIRCGTGAPSAVAELAWLLDLLVQNARYAEPALDELDRSLLPGVAALRADVKQRYDSLWDDSISGCPELLVAANDARCMRDDTPERFMRALTTGPRQALPDHLLLGEPARERRAIRRRLQLLHTDIGVRRSYRNILGDVWRLAEQRWTKRGRAVAAKASMACGRRLSSADTAAALMELMPPRHPLARNGLISTGLFRLRRTFTIVPVYFCMSGGQLADLDTNVHVGVPASALEPIRRTRDATFVADRARILAEPTRARILIHLLSSPSGIMQITRALAMTQPTVSEHVRALVRARLVVRHQRGARAVYAAPWPRAGRLIEDISATLARWA